MPSLGDGNSPYRLGFSGAIRETLRQLQRKASQQGRGEEFLAAVRYVVNRLQQDPMEFGEPLYFLPALRMHVRCGVVRPLYVHFAVCEERPLVILKVVGLQALQAP
jgi:hypothetical protein